MTTPHYRHKTTCRLCDSTRLKLAVPYPATPIADDYLAPGRLWEPVRLFPLDLYLCLDCGHVQLLDVVDPEILFRDYTYETSVSLGLVQHFRRYAQEMVAFAPPAEGALVVEIGSNDGSLLRSFAAHGLRVLGVDPALGIARKATESGIETLPCFFGSAVAQKIVAEHGTAHFVAANNVFAHADDLADMAEGVRILLSEEGVFSFEVSYLPDIIENLLFDTIYHEHLSYHSVIPLQRFLRSHGLELIDFITIPTKGGSFRGVARRLDGTREVSPAVARQTAFEEAAGYQRPEPYRAFSAALQQLKGELASVLGEAKGGGKLIAGYGASATVTTLMHYFDLAQYLDFLVDDNPVKQGTFTPGSHLEVFPSQALYQKKPDLVVILAWNYAPAILARHQAFSEAGGSFILPLPCVRAV